MFRLLATLNTEQNIKKNPLFQLRLTQPPNSGDLCGRFARSPHVLALNLVS